MRLSDWSSDLCSSDLRMLANLIPEYLSLGIPIGLMLCILLAFRRLATSSELDVLRGVGMSFGRLMRVPFAFAFALALLTLALVGFIQPSARYAYKGLQSWDERRVGNEGVRTCGIRWWT